MLNMKRIDYDTMYSIICISLHGDACIMHDGMVTLSRNGPFLYSVRNSCYKHEGDTNYAKGNRIPLL